MPLVAAKADFVDGLQGFAVDSTMIAPSGYFSDMGEFLSLARAGRVGMLGSRTEGINPSHGADLAAVADATEHGRGRLDVGGPETFTQAEIARPAFAALGRPPRMTLLPDLLRRTSPALLSRLTPRRIHRPAQFFLTAMALDMVGKAHGTRRLSDHFRRPSEPVETTEPEGATT